MGYFLSIGFKKSSFICKCRYLWIFVNIKKICWYPHNKCITDTYKDMGTGTKHIFIQRVGYKGATTRTLPALLTSLDPTRLGC